MAPLYRIAGGEPSAAVALAAVAAWQVAIALAEELYYRGMLQGGAGFGLHALADLAAGPAAAVPPALMTTSHANRSHAVFMPLEAPSGMRRITSRSAAKH